MPNWYVGGMKLETYLKTKPMTHTEFASLIGTTQVSVSRYVSGERRPSIEMIDKIEKATKGKVKMRDWFKEIPEAAQ